MFLKELKAILFIAKLSYFLCVHLLLDWAEFRKLKAWGSK